MSEIDGKYAGYIYNRRTGAKIDDDWVVFRAKDNAFAAALPYYLKACIDRKCNAAHIESVAAMIGRVDQWREDHPELCKNPD